MVRFKDVGIIVKVAGQTYEYMGEIYGKKVVGYIDSVKGGRVIVKEILEGEQELIDDVISAKSAVITEKREPSAPEKDPNQLAIF